VLSAVCPELVRDNAVPTFEMPDAVREKADPVRDIADPVRDIADPVRDIADPVRDIAASAWAAREASEPVQEICLRSTG
jgi:hypothetical protein